MTGAASPQQRSGRSNDTAGPLVAASGLRKVYRLGGDDVVALGGVDLSLDPGEFVALTGPSGSGKSAFMQIAGLLDTPTGGTYRFDGRDAYALDAGGRNAIRNRRMGFVFQSFNLLPYATAFENVVLALSSAGVREPRRARIAREKLAFAGATDLADLLPQHLSAAEQQRVAIARALANDPCLILADDPAGLLDAAASRDLMQLFCRVNAELGIALVLVTHEPAIAAYAPRVVTFRDGCVVSDVRNEQRVA